tara:strand:- start:2909 stop:3304 length:396 start_codon:yes stop_codon:yes gene_type:complete
MRLGDGEFGLIQRAKTDYRGMIAIHAGLNRSLKRSLGTSSIHFGVVVGTVEIVDSFHYRAVPVSFQHLSWAKSFLGWVWLVNNPRRLREPISLDGSPGLWDWPAGDAILAEREWLEFNEKNPKNPKNPATD